MPTPHLDRPMQPQAPAASRTPSGHAPASPDRRRIIRLLGGGSIAAATGGLAACAGGLPAEATAPWAQAQAEGQATSQSAPQADPRRFMLAHALLAPNPHNRQPWIADLSVPGQIGLVCDGERLLPHTDPFGRQILLGCGAFVELAVIAGHQLGRQVEVQAFPEGAPPAQALPRGTRVAVLRLGAAGSARPDPLFAQITRRHTSKSAYAEGRSLPPALVAGWREGAAGLGLMAGLADAPATQAQLRQITRAAYEIECLTPRTWLESAELMRIGPDAIRQHRDGISINGTMPRLLHGLGLFDPMEVPQRGAASFTRVMERWTPFETGSGYLWLATRGNDRASQLAAGRAYVRAHLQATAAGVDMHPLSQALQEFAEMRPQFDAVHRALGLDPRDQTLQMLARTGYALQPAGPSPRRGLQDLLRA